MKGMLNMKKIIAVFVCVVMLTLSIFSITAFAWDTPQLKLEASYNAKKQEITVDYRILDFAGTESADFRLKYDSNVVELKDYETVKPDSNSYIEIGEMPDEEDKIAIQYINMYYVEPDACEDDGSAVIATFTFKVTDDTATDAVFIATADSCNMDPDSEEVTLKRDTLKLSLAESTSAADESVFENENVKKIIVAAVVALVVFIGGIVAIVLKYRKEDNQ